MTKLEERIYSRIDSLKFAINEGENLLKKDYPNKEEIKILLTKFKSQLSILEEII